MIMSSKAIVYVNLGSPASPGIRNVRRYLKEFLSDPCVIDLPSAVRYLLVRGIIVPVRSVHSSRLYSNIWSERGFPLIYHGEDLLSEIRKMPHPGYDLFLAMRYGEPSLTGLLEQLKESGYQEIRIIPLFPQFASSTTGSIIRITRQVLQGSRLLNHTGIMLQFHQHEGFIRVWQKKISRMLAADHDAVIFSYHGIPVRHAEAAHPGRTCEELHCRQQYSEENMFCYQASCFQTTRSIASGLKHTPARIITSFQSRFGRNWLEPQTKKILQSLAAGRLRKILVVSPSFVADCLETEVEIGLEYRELFIKAGGKELALVPSLNSDHQWAGVLLDLATGQNNFVELGNADCKIGSLR